VAAVPSVGRATDVERPAVNGAAAAGDLYERYSGQIYGYCLHQLGSREEAEDAVQTTFMNAFRGLQRGIVPELESAWLFKIAHNVCLSRRRSSWRRGRVETPNNFEVLQEIVPGREQVADELIRLQDVLEDMPENQRRAILLREWQGLTYREISTELGLSQAAVETLIFRARRALAQGLEQDADTWKKRLRRGADVGGVIACVKTLLSGGGAAAIKIGTTAALVAGAAVTAATLPVAPKHTPAPVPLKHPHVVPHVAQPAPRPVTHVAAVAHVVAQRPVRGAPAVSRAHAAAAVPHTAPPVSTPPTALLPEPDETVSATPPPPPAAAPAAETESAAPPPPVAPAPPVEQSAAPVEEQPAPPPAAEEHGNKPADKPAHPGKEKPDNGHGNDGKGHDK
jgi:RNA polymerase sigma factor (sigma-70 family)